MAIRENNLMKGGKYNKMGVIKFETRYKYTCIFVKIITICFNVLYSILLLNDMILMHISEDIKLKLILDSLFLMIAKIHLSFIGLLLPIIFIYNLVFIILCKIKKKIELKRFLIWFILASYNFYFLCYLIFHST